MPLGVASKAAIGTTVALGALHARANPLADEQVTRMSDFMNAKKHNMSAAMPDLAVKMSNAIDEFAREKLAALGDGQQTIVMGVPKVHQQMTQAFGDAAADIAIKQPIYALHKLLKKKLYTEPEQTSVFSQVLQNDPELARAHAERPEVTTRLYKTLKTYAPSLTTDHNAVRNFMNQGLMLNGEVDHTTIKLLADTEKTIRQSRGELNGGY